MLRTKTGATTTPTALASGWQAEGLNAAMLIHGSTDELGYKVAEDGVSVRDFQATFLHALGLDPFEFSFFSQGLQQRLIGPANTPKIVDKLLT